MARRGSHQAAGRARPTSGKVLQALFNILGPLEGVDFLDLFAGSGRVSVEAASRGARVTAVEVDRRCCEAMRTLGGFRVVQGDVRRFILRAAREGDSYGVVFADPPYCMGWVEELLELLRGNRTVVAPGGLVVLEHSVREPIPEGLGADSRVYGETVLSFVDPFREGGGL